MRKQVTSRRDERGQTSLFIVGIAVVLLMVLAVVIDASAAFLQRQGLDTVADGAALTGADAGGRAILAEGIPEQRLDLITPTAHAAVGAYLASVDAYRRFPGLSYDVSVDPLTRSVEVRLRAPADLPLTFPGSPTGVVGAEAAAAVTVTR